MSASSKSVVFITGLFISNCCWDEWVLYFESKGYQCHAPAWPFKDALAEELRNRPDNDPIELNTIESIIEHYTACIGKLKEKPILIGHSVGGLIAQVLSQRELAIAAVAIHSSPPSGVIPFNLSFHSVAWHVMALFCSPKKNYLMPFSAWRYSMANGLEYDHQKELYYEYVVPESRKVIREVLEFVTKIDFNKPHVPLLFTSGTHDKLNPASVNYHNYKKYLGGNSVTEYTEFNGHSHLVFGVPGWKKEADYILHWLEGISRLPY